jgi:hypothetical protein
VEFLIPFPLIYSIVQWILSAQLTVSISSLLCPSIGEPTLPQVQVHSGDKGMIDEKITHATMPE